MNPKKLVPKILELCLHRTQECLISQTGVAVEDIERAVGQVEQIGLRDFTAVIAVGGPVSFLVSFSLDRPLLEVMFMKFTEGLDIAEEEYDEFRTETLGEIVNLIMGQTTTDLGTAGAVLSVSPPIVFTGTRQIRRPRSAEFSSAFLNTKEGVLQVSVIGPPELFDSYLNEVDGGA